jgi:hypothetical protein
MHPKWQALQSKFGITCDMSIENTSKSVATHDNAEENPICPLNLLERSLNKRNFVAK